MTEDTCSEKRCDLINQILKGTVDESYYCRTHKRHYYPNEPTDTMINPVTPTEQDKELREQLTNMQVEFLKKGGMDNLIPHIIDTDDNAGQAMRDEIMQLITADRKRVALEAAKVTGDTSDGYHTFNELYDYRRVYNAALFNEWASQGKYDVHKSWKHSDGKDCFGGGWFIVMAELPTGQISNHYEAQYWNSFVIPAKDTANEYDGHTPKQALSRIAELKAQQEEV